MAEIDGGMVRQVLDALGHDLDPSILIGGWATNIHVGGDISYDIDLIMKDRSVDAKLYEHLDEVSTNEVHQGKKYKVVKDGVALDIYIPFESQLGDKLRLRVEKLIPYAEPFEDSGWYLLDLDAHFTTKLAALLDRPSSVKGEKDARELHRLLLKGIDASRSIEVLLTATAGDIERIPGRLSLAFELISELSGANRAERKVLMAQRREWVDEAVRAVAKRRTPDAERPTFAPR